MKDLELYEDSIAVVDSFLYFMWNRFNDIEIAKIPWHCNVDHMQNKWAHFSQKYGAIGGVAWFWSELDDHNRRILMDYINENYKVYQKK